MKCTAVVLLAAMACGELPPVPPSLQPDDGANGSRVRYGELSGYLARPTGSSPQRAQLWIAQADFGGLELKARIRASENTLVMIVSGDTDLDAARAYLLGQLPSEADVTICPAGQCP